MAMRREELYRLIDNLPDEKLASAEKYLKKLSIPEEEPTEEEKKAIEEAMLEYENGETYSYSIEELRKEFLPSE